MPFVTQSFISEGTLPLWEEILLWSGLSKESVLRMIDKGQVQLNGKIILSKTIKGKGEISLVKFEPVRLSNVEPIYINNDFVAYDKPSGLLVHPRKHDHEISLLDEIRFRFGHNANIVHRIDQETSGIVVASLHKESERVLKRMFSEQKVFKEYKALIRGKFPIHDVIDVPLSAHHDEKIRLKMVVSNAGLASLTEVRLIDYDSTKDISYVAAFPKTGRQHQIRAHLFHVKHPILGDPLYGMSADFSDKFLKREVTQRERAQATGAHRLLLHAHKIKFYYEDQEHCIETKDPKESLLSALL